MILQNGFRTGLTLYPETKVSIQRAVDIIERYGAERIYANSACDWGHSLPLAVPQFMMEMRRRGHTESLIHRLVYENPLEFMSQSPKFCLKWQSGRYSSSAREASQ